MENESKVLPYEPELDIKNQQDRFIVNHTFQNYQDIPPNTLDDGVCRTLGNELAEMFYKFSFALVPRNSTDSIKLRNWDLWGPFFMCLIFGIFTNDSQQLLTLFAAVFGGAIIVTFNTRILGGNISYFQSVSILGYCMFPLFIILLLLKILSLFGVSSLGIRLIGVVLSTIWGVLSAQVFIASNITASKRFVSLYPICLFYLFIGLLVLYM